MVIAESMYGSDRAGLVCGYVFQPGVPGRAIESDAAAGHLAARPRGDEFLWLHFSLTNAASVPWLQEHVSLPDSFYDSVKDGASTRVEVVDGALLAVINDLQFFAAEGSSAATVTLYVTERIIVSVRTTQLRAIDRLRASVKHGEPFRSPAELLAHLLRDQADVLVEIVRDARSRSTRWKTGSSRTARPADRRWAGCDACWCGCSACSRRNLPRCSGC